MPTKLNQIVAVEKGAKQRTAETLSKLLGLFQHPEIFNGLKKSYQPKDDEGDRLPDEGQILQGRVSLVIDAAVKVWTEQFDTVLTKEVGNCTAKADVVVDGAVVMSQVPVSYLIQMEKWLEEVKAFIAKAPILDPTMEWEWDEASSLYRSKPVETHRTQKVQDFVVVAGSGVPEKGVPPVVKDVTKDVIAGYWTTVKLSGAMEITKRAECFDRADSLLKAVKIAREEANSIEVAQFKAAEGVFAHIFGN